LLILECDQALTENLSQLFFPGYRLTKGGKFTKFFALRKIAGHLLVHISDETQAIRFSYQSYDNSRFFIKQWQFLRWCKRGTPSLDQAAIQDSNHFRMEPLFVSHHDVFQ
jgi:hypothetical protein